MAHERSKQKVQAQMSDLKVASRKCSKAVSNERVLRP